MIVAQVVLQAVCLEYHLWRRNWYNCNPHRDHVVFLCFVSLQWRHYGYDSVSNHQHHECLLNRLFRRRSKKTSKLRVTGPREGNSLGANEFPAQKASNAQNVSIWWRHHDDEIGITTTRKGARVVLLCFILLWLIREFPVDSYDIFIQIFRGLSLLSGRASYRKISWSLEAVRFGFKLFQSLWNWTGTSAAILLRCLSNFRTFHSICNLAASRLHEIVQ